MSSLDGIAPGDLMSAAKRASGASAQWSPFLPCDHWPQPTSTPMLASKQMWNERNGQQMFQDLAARTSFMIRRGWFPALWLFIGAVSAMDCYLVFRFRDLMWELEENPIGRYLIELDNGNVTVFILTKAAGTVVVMCVLAGLYVYRRRWSFPITGSIAAFQLTLFIYVGLSIPIDPAENLPTSHDAHFARPRTVLDDVSLFLPASGWEPPICDPVRWQ
jgi:hypothetical protein